jgi:DNA polymerase III subunit delta
MARIWAKEFKEKLGKVKLLPAVLLYGDQPFLRDACRVELVERFVPQAARTWAVSRFSAERGQTQAALDQAQTIPMLSTQQVVFLEDAEAIEDLGEKNRETTIAALEGYLKDPAPFTVLVVEASKLDMRMQLGKKLSEQALVVEVGLGENSEERNAASVVLAKSLAKKSGVEFAPGAAEDLSEFVSGDLLRLKTEVDKLTTFAAERRVVRREDVSALVISEKTTTIWEVADLLAKRKPKQALEFIERLLRAGEEPVLMVGGMAWMYRKLIEASEIHGSTNGWQAARALGMRPEQAELALQCAHKISKSRLLDGLRALQEADDRLKGGAKDPRTVMEFLIWQLTGARAAGAP